MSGHTVPPPAWTTADDDLRHALRVYFGDTLQFVGEKILQGADDAQASTIVGQLRIMPCPVKHPAALDTHRTKHTIAVRKSPVKGIDSSIGDAVDENHGRTVVSIATRAAAKSDLAKYQRPVRAAKPK
jgi:hypothetical protein